MHIMFIESDATALQLSYIFSYIDLTKMWQPVCEVWSNVCFSVTVTTLFVIENFMGLFLAIFINFVWLS